MELKNDTTALPIQVFNIVTPFWTVHALSFVKDVCYNIK